MKRNPTTISTFPLSKNEKELRSYLSTSRSGPKSLPIPPRRIVASVCCAAEQTPDPPETSKKLIAKMSFLGNRYWVLRHGKSIPNEKGLIVSSLQNGVLDEYKLTSEGVNQAQLAGESFLKELKENGILLENVRICYSPFSRTSHTAKVVASVLNIPFEGPQCKVFEDLRERYFGPSFELSSHDRYADIWDLDAKDPFMQPEGGESVADVVSRLTRVLVEIESEFKGCAILVVCHGDPLQILQTIINAAKENVVSDSTDLESRIQAIKVSSVLSQHRKFGLLTGELRAAV